MQSATIVPRGFANVKSNSFQYLQDQFFTFQSDCHGDGAFGIGGRVADQEYDRSVQTDEVESV